MHNTDAVVNPDAEDRTDKAIRIGLVIDEQPENSYVPMLTVLRTNKELGRTQSSVNSAIQHLEAKIQAGDKPENVPAGISKEGILFGGRMFVLTGKFSLFSREAAVGWLESVGAKVSGSLSSKTNYLIMGQDGNEGKLRRAQAMGIPVLTEQDFSDMMQQ